MKVSIENSYSDGFSITVEGAQREDMLAIRKVTDERQQIIQKVFYDTYTEPRNWTREQQQAFVKIAQWSFRETDNKIMTIKFLRTLCEPSLGLKDAKDIADYAIHGADVSNVTWLKS